MIGKVIQAESEGMNPDRILKPNPKGSFLKIGVVQGFCNAIFRDFRPFSR